MNSLLSKYKAFLLTFLVVLPSLVWAQKITNPRPFARSISIEDMRKNLSVIASADMEGRETATEGQRKAAAYIENEFKSIGLAPGNKDSYEMYFPVYADSLLNLSLSVNDTEFTAGKDFSVYLQSGYSARYYFSEIVFVGEGRSDQFRDDYKDIDVRGKLVMAFSDEHGKIGDKSNQPRLNWIAQQLAAMKNGAAALLIVTKRIPPLVSKSNMYVNLYQKSQRLNTFFISTELAEKISGIQLNELRNENRPAVYEANTALNLSKVSLEMQSSNVLGFLEGSDLKDEFVILTAHYDHLGKRGDTIWYGADDDGSGTVTILELAKAFSEAKKAGKGPRRSILFMTVSGEEKGLWGSDYYASHPTVDLDKVTVNLNIDMVGRIDPSRKYGDSTRYIYVIGDDKLSSDLKSISEAVNKKYTKLELDYKYNDPKDPERIYYRSDHYNFAKNGVPVIFYFSGLHPDYHKPTDTPDKINFPLLQKRALLVFYTAWEMANRNQMLKRDIPLP
ncbi:MAG: M28 family peptidase [Chitinophagaceae bacterium]|nr:M28 family peptidase [Chitinophagaceae bacterium]